MFKQEYSERREQLWAMFVVGAAARDRGGTPADVAKMADGLLSEFEKRFVEEPGND